MSIANEITRIQTDRNTMRTKLVDLGLVQSTADLDDIAAAVEGIDNRGAVSAQVQEGDTYTIPKGYHNGSGTVSGVSGGGNYSLQSKSITPTKAQQNVTPDSGYYGLSDVTVGAIPENYQDVSSVTAAAADVLANKIIVDKTGKPIVGAMPNNGAVNQTVSVATPSYTIPAGYHSGSGKVSVTTETKTATPTKVAQDITPANGKVLSKVTVEPIPEKYQDVSKVDATADKVLDGSTFVDAEGNVVYGTMVDHSGPVNGITLTPDNTVYFVPEGYHPEGNTQVKVEFMGKTVTPTKEAQWITGKGFNGNEDLTVFLDSVLVQPIPDEFQDISGVTATAADVLSGKKIVGSDGMTATGTMTDNGAVTASLNTSTTSYTVPKGYHNGSGKVSITTETKSATPTKSAQTISPSSGKVLSSVSVAAIPAAYQDVTGVTAKASHVLDGMYFVDSTGAKVEGTIASYSSFQRTFDGLSITSVGIPDGYITGGTVSLTDDIENALKAI